MNLDFEKPDGSVYTLDCGPVLVSPNVLTSTFGIKTELCFKETHGKQQEHTLTFVTADNEKIVMLFYKKTDQNASACFIRVSKVTVVNNGNVKLVKAKIHNAGTLKPPLIFNL